MENQKPKVSVIIPVYNPGSGIDKCIESVRSQTLHDIEIIFIDDCGNDNSMEKVRKAAAIDERIIILTNSENLGPGFSRNRGIETSHGEYLSFIDADDFVNNAFLEELYHKAKSRDFDIVKGKSLIRLKDGTLIHWKTDLNTTIANGLQQGTPLYLLFTYEHWTAIYRRQMVLESDARYGSSTKGEDTLFLLRVTLAAKMIGFAGDAFYYYCKRENSAVHRKDIGILKASLDSTIEKFEILKQKCFDDPYAPQYAANIINGFLSSYAYISQITEKKDEAINLLQTLRHEVSKLPFNHILTSKNIAIRALVEYGENISDTPYKFPGEEPPPEQQLEILNRWCTFFITHSNLDEQYRKSLKSVFEKTMDYFELQGRSNENIEAIYASETWKIGNAMVQPLHFVKSILSKIFARNHL